MSNLLGQKQDADKTKSYLYNILKPYLRSSPAKAGTEPLQKTASTTLDSINPCIKPAIRRTPPQTAPKSTPGKTKVAVKQSPCNCRSSSKVFLLLLRF